ncbi:hypothetical protein LG329_04670 [Virgibacillus necropolis]|uniref:hypothetical protein n=1 Tax=Virgibacillus necropolis TaxID=163877 RepID=UPI0038507A4B
MGERIDSIEHGLEHLEAAIKNDDAYDYKRVVLDFCHAAQLLLKEILFRIDSTRLVHIAKGQYVLIFI